VSSLCRRSHSRLLVLPTALSSQHHLPAHLDLSIRILSLSQHRTPQYRCSLHLSVIGIRHLSPSTHLGLISPILPRSLPPSASHHYTPPILHSIFTILPTTQPLHRKHTIIPCGTELFTAIQHEDQSHTGNNWNLSHILPVTYFIRSFISNTR